MQTFNVEQGTPEWFAARAGIITASCMGDVLAKGQGKTRRAYMYKLIGERMTGEVSSGFGGNRYTERGHELEPIVRELYAEQTGQEVNIVGFMRNHEDIGGVGYSPDGDVDGGLVEFKTREPHLQAELLDTGFIPSDHRWQCKSGMWVGEKPWIDYVSFCPGMPLFEHRFEIQTEEIEEMRKGVIDFYAEMNAIMKRITDRAA